MCPSAVSSSTWIRASSRKSIGSPSGTRGGALPARAIHPLHALPRLLDAGLQVRIGVLPEIDEAAVVLGRVLSVARALVQLTEAIQHWREIDAIGKEAPIPIHLDVPGEIRAG